MPHCVIEYSKDLIPKIKMSSFMAGLREVIVGSDLFNPEAIKIRALAYEDYLLSDRYEFFVHIDLKILEGRTDSQKEALAKAVQEYALSITENSPVALSTEVIDMDKKSYQKR